MTLTGDGGTVALTATLTLKHASETCGRLVKTYKLLGLMNWFNRSGVASETFISSKYPADPDTAGPKTTL